MTPDLIVTTADGTPFEDAPDRGRVMISAEQTGGAYSLMEWTIASRGDASTTDHRDFGPHVHAAIDEVFVIQRGTLDFLVGDQITTVSAGDVVRVPAGTRHGYCNRSGHDVEMLVWFSPGGFEHLFVTYRSDQHEPAAVGDGFVADAGRDYDSTFEV